MQGIPFPLKFTSSLNLISSFEQQVMNKYGKEVVKLVHPILEEMQNLRNSLDYNKINAIISIDYHRAAEYQQKIINYLHYVFLVDDLFKSGFISAESLQFSFSWTDSFEPKKIKQMSLIKFELVSCLYNLAICYYLEGIALTSKSDTQEKLKGIARLRLALWCIKEIKQHILALLTKSSELPSDLNLSYLNLLYNYLIGLIYAALADLLSADKKKNRPEKISSVYQAASKHFQIALNIIVPLYSCPISDLFSKKLKLNLVYNIVMLRSEALFQIAQLHLQYVDKQVEMQHMGLAVSYLKLSKAEFDEVIMSKSNLELWTPEQKTAFLERAEFITAAYHDYQLKNRQVYKQEVYFAFDLPPLPEEKIVINPIEPKDLKKKLENERFFDAFLSPEILRLRKEFISSVKQKMLDTENDLRNAYNLKNKLYAEGYVNYLLALNSRSKHSIEIYAELKAKVNEFQQNGVIAAYQSCVKNIEQTGAACGKLVNDIRVALAADKTEEENLKSAYTTHWTKPYFEQVNQDYTLKLKDLEQKFYVAQNKDKEIIKQFDKYQDWIQKFSMPDEQIWALFSKSTDIEFNEQNHRKVMELVELDTTLTNLVDIEKITSLISSITEEFLKTDFMASFAAIQAESADKDAEFEKLLDPYKARLSQIESQVDKAYPLIELISSQTKEIIVSNKDTDQDTIKIFEEIGLAITAVHDALRDIQQSVTFYSKLNCKLNLLRKSVTDLRFARGKERSSLEEELNAQRGAENMTATLNIVLSEHYFYKFPIFISNQNRYPNQPGQMYNPAQNHNQTQAYNPQMQGNYQTQIYIHQNTDKSKS